MNESAWDSWPSPSRNLSGGVSSTTTRSIDAISDDIRNVGARQAPLSPPTLEPWSRPMTPEQIDEFLREPRLCDLATVRPETASHM